MVTFDHTYDFEATFDGGVIEFSVDNGTTWADVTTLTGVTPGYTDALGDRPRQSDRRARWRSAERTR